MSSVSQAKPIALYFPQFHPIPENDQWWGKGFTDWVNVRKAKPLFDGHNQPRVPANGRYYDLCEEDVMRWQIDMAQSYGIHGFCHYHYWFDGKQMLETPTNQFLSAKDRHFPFCLAWANETWSRRWDGRDHHILQEQTHPPKVSRWAMHFKYLIKAWSDERAIRVDGKPVFLIYRPARIKQLDSLMDYWQSRAREYGIDGIYFVAMVQHKFPPKRVLQHFDAAMLFQPFYSMYGLRDAAEPTFRQRAWQKAERLPGWMKAPLKDLTERLKGPTLMDYDEIWEAIVDEPMRPKMPIFPGAFVDWDNTARYGRRATIFQGANPERFQYWLSQLLERGVWDRNPERLFFVNAWNEWAEGAYLEPDAKQGLGYLEALQSALRPIATREATVRPLHSRTGITKR